MKWLVKIGTVIASIFIARWATDLSTPQKDWARVERAGAHWANSFSLGWNAACVGLTRLTGLDKAMLWWVRYRYRRGDYQMEGT